MLQEISPEENPEIRNIQQVLQNAEFGLWVCFLSTALHATRTPLATLPDPELCCFRYHFHSEKLRQIPSGCWVRDALTLFIHLYIKAEKQFSGNSLFFRSDFVHFDLMPIANINHN